MDSCADFLLRSLPHNASLWPLGIGGRESLFSKCEWEQIWNGNFGQINVDLGTSWAVFWMTYPFPLSVYLLSLSSFPPQHSPNQWSLLSPAFCCSVGQSLSWSQPYGFASFVPLFDYPSLWNILVLWVCLRQCFQEQLRLSSLPLPHQAVSS